MNGREKLYKGSGVLRATSLRAVSFELLGSMFDLELVLKKKKRPEELLTQSERPRSVLLP